jgi:hypothetical protein
MRNLVVRLLVCLTALALFTFVAVSSGHAKEKTSSRLNASIKTSAAAKQPRLFDADGYRLVSHASTMRCRQTLQGSLECRSD